MAGRPAPTDGVIGWKSLPWTVYRVQDRRHRRATGGDGDGPFHVVRLAGNALDECRRRVQLATCGHRGRKTDPLYRSRRTLQTGPIC